VQVGWNVVSDNVVINADVGFHFEGVAVRGTNNTLKNCDRGIVSIDSQVEMEGLVIE